MWFCCHTNDQLLTNGFIAIWNIDFDIDRITGNIRLPLTENIIT